MTGSVGWPPILCSFGPVAPARTNPVAALRGRSPRIGGCGKRSFPSLDSGARTDVRDSGGRPPCGLLLARTSRMRRHVRGARHSAHTRTDLISPQAACPSWACFADHVAPAARGDVHRLRCSRRSSTPPVSEVFPGSTGSRWLRRRSWPGVPLAPTARWALHITVWSRFCSRRHRRESVAVVDLSVPESWGGTWSIR